MTRGWLLPEEGGPCNSLPVLSHHAMYYYSQKMGGGGGYAAVFNLGRFTGGLFFCFFVFEKGGVFQK